MSASGWNCPCRRGFGAFLPPGFEPWCGGTASLAGFVFRGMAFRKADPRHLGGSLGFPGNCEGIRMCPGAASDTAMALFGKACHHIPRVSAKRRGHM